MNILTSIFTDDLAIDLGTVNTLIFAPERGVVLDEPSAVAIHKYTGEVLDVGAEAHKMLGREPKDVEIFRPVRGGNIENFDAVEKMLKAFIARVNGYHHRRSHVVIGVPGSSTTLEQRSVRDAARDAKATRVDLVDEGLCAALGAGLSYDDERAHLVVDIGGGTTNVAIVACGAIVASHSSAAAGNSKPHCRASLTTPTTCDGWPVSAVICLPIGSSSAKYCLAIVSLIKMTAGLSSLTFCEGVLNRSMF